MKMNSTVKVTLINLPQLNVLDDRQYPPLGPLYLAAQLRREDIEVCVVDLASKRPSDWPSLINNDSNIYTITCFTPSIGYAKSLVRICKEKNPECLLVIGGPHASAAPVQTLEYTKCDVVFTGEGELAILDFVKKYISKKNFSKIINARAITDLDSLAFPARDLVDHSTYSATLLNKKTTGIISSRGCPYHCSFCDKKVFGANVRYRSEGNVLAELRELKDLYGYSSFFFYDDIFILNKKRNPALMRGIKELEMQYLCDGRVNLMTKELLHELKDSGCVKIAYGIESGSQKILDKINKQTTILQCAEAIQMAKEVGIIVKCYFIFGLPGENEKSVEETKKLIEMTGPDQTNLYTFNPYPGSDIWNRPEYYGVKIINKDFVNYFMISTNGLGGINCLPSGLSEEKYIELRDDLLKFIRERNLNRPAMSSNV